MVRIVNAIGGDLVMIGHPRFRAFVVDAFLGIGNQVFMGSGILVSIGCPQVTYRVATYSTSLNGWAYTVGYNGEPTPSPTPSQGYDIMNPSSLLPVCRAHGGDRCATCFYHDDVYYYTGIGAAATAGVNVIWGRQLEDGGDAAAAGIIHYVITSPQQHDIMAGS